MIIDEIEQLNIQQQNFANYGNRLQKLIDNLPATINNLCETVDEQVAVSSDTVADDDK